MNRRVKTTIALLLDSDFWMLFDGRVERSRREDGMQSKILAVVCRVRPSTGDKHVLGTLFFTGLLFYYLQESVKRNVT